MKTLRGVLCLALLALLLGCERSSETSSTSNGSEITASDRERGTNASDAATVEPDNTGRNARDRAGEGLTPRDQGGSEADRETTRRIRQGIIANDWLSTDARNIKIITINGKVTLRGPIKNEQELDVIKKIAQQAGATALDNQLELTNTNANK